MTCCSFFSQTAENKFACEKNYHEEDYVISYRKIGSVCQKELPNIIWSSPFVPHFMFLTHILKSIQLSR